MIDEQDSSTWSADRVEVAGPGQVIEQIFLAREPCGLEESISEGSGCTPGSHLEPGWIGREEALTEQLQNVFFPCCINIGSSLKKYLILSRLGAKNGKYESYNHQYYHQELKCSQYKWITRQFSVLPANPGVKSFIAPSFLPQ